MSFNKSVALRATGFLAVVGATVFVWFTLARWARHFKGTPATKHETVAWLFEPLARLFAGGTVGNIVGQAAVMTFAAVLTAFGTHQAYLSWKKHQ